MSSRTPTKPRKGWRTISLSVRALMLLTAILGLFLARLANRAEAQRRAVGLVNSATGGVVYDNGVNLPTGICVVSTPPSSRWDWVRKRVGEDYFRTVTTTAFGWDGSDEDQFEPIPDEALRSLLDLPGMHTLQIHHRTLNDEQFAIIGGLASLHGLELLECRGFTGRGLDQLAGLRNLTNLEIVLDEITDEDLAVLARLNTLEVILLGRSPCLDGSWLRHLRDLPRFRLLSLQEANLTDQGQEEIARLVHLQDLWIDACPDLTDEGIRAIANLTDLRGLSLSGLAGITDRGIYHLGRLKGLQYLSLERLCLDGWSLGSLAEMEHLEDLTLGDSPISDEGLLAAAAVRSLKKLVTYNLATSDDAVAAFEAMRPGLLRRGGFSMRPSPPPDQDDDEADPPQE